MQLSGSMKLLAVVRSEETKESFTSALTDVNGAKFDVFVGRVGDLGSELIDVHNPDVLVLDIDLSDTDEVAALDKVIQDYGDKASVIATSHEADLDGVRRLMRLGVSDFLPQPIGRSDLIAALEHAARKASKTESSGAKIFSFIKPVGGMGATMLAVQSACCLTNLRRKAADVCLLDLDIQFGNAGVYLDLDSRYSILDALHTPGDLDGTFLRGIMAHHESGVEVLCAPATLMPLDVVTPELIAQLLDVAAKEYEYIVIDLPQALTEWTQVVLSRSDMVFLVTQLSVAAVRQSRRLLDIVREEGIEDGRTSVVVNRFEKSWGRRVTEKEAEKALGRRIDFVIPNDYKTVNAALNEGVRLSEIKVGSKVEKRINELFQTVLS